MLLALTLGGRRLFERVRRAGRGPALQRALGAIMLVTAIAILTNLDVKFDRPFAALPEGSGSRYDMMQACARAGFVPAISIEVGDMFTLEGIVGAGLGVSVVPESMRGHVQPSVARIPLRESVPTRRQISLVYVRGSETRRPVTALLRALSS